jgi:hypothetical protein
MREENTYMFYEVEIAFIAGIVFSYACYLIIRFVI